MTIQQSQTLATVQAPIIPVVGEWTFNTPGTLSLGQGMVAYPPPASALTAISEFGNLPAHHLYGSPLGYPDLLEAIVEKLRLENRIDCASGYRVMVTAGSNMAFLSVLMAIADPGDEIILPLPYYFNQEMAIRMLNCRPVCVATNDQYQLDVPAIAAAITAKTRAIVTVSPNNPTGAVYSEADLRAINALCREHGLYHISDEAYEYFTYDNALHFSPASIADAQAHTISLFSLSKAYGFASWRVGYMVFPEALLPALLKVQDTNLICPPLITQVAALGALQTGAQYCRSQLAIRQQMLNQLGSLSTLCTVIPNQGAFYLLLKISTEKPDLDLVKTLISDYQVAVIPGCAFGLHNGCYLRVSYGMLDQDRADMALQRLLTGLKALC